MIIEGLQEKYVSDETQLYFKNGMQAFENEDYMTAAMYLLALLDNRVNELVDAERKPLGRLSGREVHRIYRWSRAFDGDGHGLHAESVGPHQGF